MPKSFNPSQLRFYQPLTSWRQRLPSNRYEYGRTLLAGLTLLAMTFGLLLGGVQGAMGVDKRKVPMVVFEKELGREGESRTVYPLLSESTRYSQTLAHAHTSAYSPGTFFD